MQDIVDTTKSASAPTGPSLSRQSNAEFAVAAGGNAGAIAIESDRAVAEAQGQLILAKKFPRDNAAAFAELMDACKIPALAAVAFYEVPRAGTTVSGPSIRLAEEIARCYGNFEYGHRELSRGPTKSEVEVYAWDKEKNNRSIRQITVEHVRDTRDGPKKLRDQKDIDDKIANVASKQVRGRILALVPKWMVQSAIEECQKTIAGNNDVPVSERVRRMTAAFAKFGVTVPLLETRLGHSLDQTTVEELVQLTGIHNSLREGTAASEFFSTAEQDDKSGQDAAAAITSIAQQAQQPAAAAAQPKPDRAPRRAAQAPAAASAPAQSTAAAHTSTAPTAGAQTTAAAAPVAQQAPASAQPPAAAAADDDVF